MMQPYASASTMNVDDDVDDDGVDDAVATSTSTASTSGVFRRSEGVVMRPSAAMHSISNTNGSMLGGGSYEGIRGGEGATTTTSTTMTMTTVRPGRPVRRYRTVYRGGWSSSIQDLFRNPAHRTDCCALMCCGALLSDRNMYLLRQLEQIVPSNSNSNNNNNHMVGTASFYPVNWWLRLGLNCCVPVVLLVVLVMVTVFASVEPARVEPGAFADDFFTGTDDNFGGDDGGFRDRFHYQHHRRSQATDSGAALSVLIVQLLTVVAVAVLLLRATRYRMRQRRLIMEFLHQQRGASDSSALMISDCDLRSAKGCCCCYGKDDTQMVESTHSTNSSIADQRSDDGYDLPVEGHRIVNSLQSQDIAPPEDLMSVFWKGYSYLCCYGCCGCWLQMFGMCATAQEDRALRKVWQRQILMKEHQDPHAATLLRKLLQVDFVSFQPYAEYYPAILHLRQHGVDQFNAHARRLSKLSRQCVCWFMVYIAFHLVITILHGVKSSKQPQYDDDFVEQMTEEQQQQNKSQGDGLDFAHFIILLLTWGQAFLILYFVYWKWYRLRISLDAVIKYFASGFLFSCIMAIIVEMLVSTVIDFIFQIIFVSEEIEEQDRDPKQFLKDNLGTFSLSVFFSAFLVAALVEEICKYYGFWMVETPDLMDPRDIILDDQDLQGTNGSPNHATYAQAASTASASTRVVDLPARNLVSQGANITVAMVATAVGFACAENIMYVFSSNKIADELFVLILRGVLPVHPLCAALQSIGVCRRDLEGDRKSQLGRIALPAILVHGLFDFVLMLYHVVRVADSDDDVYASMGDDTQTSQQSPKYGESLLSSLLAVPVVLGGIFFYYVMAERQRRRLAELDHAESAGELMMVTQVGSRESDDDADTELL